MTKLNGHAVHLQPITLRNEAATQELYTRVKLVMGSSNAETVMAVVREAIRQNPEVTEYLNEHGNISAVAIEQAAEVLRASHLGIYEHEKKLHEEKPLPEGEEREPFKAFEPLDETELYTQATKNVNDQFKLFLKQNQEVARTLYFNMTGYPCTLEALKLGIEVIKATVNRTQTKSDVVALIDSDITSDFWQDVDASEVAAYVDNFCRGRK